jgi:hypothetical protein
MFCQLEKMSMENDFKFGSIFEAPIVDRGKEYFYQLGKWKWPV